MAKVFTPNAIINECNKPGKSPSTVLTLDMRKNPKTYNTGGGTTTYRDWNAQVGNVKAGVKILWHSANPEKYIEITRGAIDPLKSEYAAEQNARKVNCVTIETTIGKSHELGIFEDLNDRTFNDVVNAKSRLPADNPEFIKLYQETEIPGRGITTTIVREVKTPVSRRYSTRDKTPAHLRGKVRDDPVIRYEVDFDKYPASFGKMANTPKTIIRDYKKPVVTREGKTIYAEATVMNEYGTEEKLCAANAYKFLTRGSRVYQIVLNESTGAIHDKYVSNKVTINEIIVESIAESGQQVIGDDGEVIGDINITDGIDHAFAPAPTLAPASAPAHDSAYVPAALPPMASPPPAADIAAAAAATGIDEDAVKKLLSGVNF